MLALTLPFAVPTENACYSNVENLVIIHVSSFCPNEATTAAIAYIAVINLHTYY